MQKAGRKTNDGTAIAADKREAVLKSARQLWGQFNSKELGKVLHEIREHISAQAQSNAREKQLAELGLLDSDVAINEDEFAAKTLERTLLGKSTLNRRYINTLYYHIYFKHRDVFDEALRQGIMAHEPSLGGMRPLLGYPKTVTDKELRRYIGRYQLLRTFPYDARALLISGELCIGVNRDESPASSPFDCRYEYSYQTDEHQADRTLRGKIVVHGNRATIVLSDDHNLFFQFYVDYHAGNAPRSSFAGIALTDTRGSDLASSWPFFARGIPGGEGCETGILNPAEVGSQAQRQLGRGAVHWDPARFPGLK